MSLQNSDGGGPGEDGAKEAKARECLLDLVSPESEGAAQSSEKKWLKTLTSDMIPLGKGHL